jgi:hypothetical protein
MLLCLVACGCTSTYVTYDRFATDGQTKTSTLTVHRRTLASKVSMPGVKFNPDGTAELSGYQNDGGSEVTGGLIKSACEGAVKGALK